MEPNMLNSEVTIQCCATTGSWNKHRCKNKIEFTEKSQFDSYTDKDNKRIYYYIANDYALHRQPSDTAFSYELVYGNIVRIFCHDCSCSMSIFCRYPRIRRCKFNLDKRHNRCSNKDTDFVLGILFTQSSHNWAEYANDSNYDVWHEICRNHAICNGCDKALAYNAIKCKKCKNRFCVKATCCDRNKKICKQCSVIYEYKNIYNVIKVGIDAMDLLHDIDSHILKMIAQNAMGIGTLCCNKDDECKNDIICNNMHEFRNKIDYNSGKIHYYKPTYFNPHQKPTVLVHNERLRVFCSWCTQHNVHRCTKQRKMTYNVSESRGFLLCENIRESGDGICGNHPFCAKCKGQKKDSALDKCNKCEEYFCDLHMIESQRRKRCEDCVCRMEWRQTKRRIKLSTKYMQFDDESFIDIIASFAIGTAVICSNEACKNEIIINNEYQFEKCCDYNGDEIDYVEANSNTHRGIVTIYSKYRIVFCALCTGLKRQK